jgi:hypothetical protein
VVLQTAATRTGTMDITCPDLATAQQVERSLSQALVFMLRQSDQNTVDLYFVPTNTDMSHGDQDWTSGENPERRWTVTVTFTEVGWPVGDVVPIQVWTYNDVAAGYGDYNALSSSFATYADLLERLPS